MKLVVFGLSISSSWGNGHATLWRGLCRSLGERGHRVVFFERDVPYYASHRDTVEIPGAELILYDDWQNNLARARQELRNATAAIVTSYCPDGIAATDLLLSADAPLRVFYDLDTPVTLHNLRDGQPPAYLGPRGLADFDLVLSYTGGEALVELRTRLGARHVAPLYGSVDPEVHRPVPPQPQYQCDLSYMGTYSADRQDTLDLLFLEAARRLPEYHFLIGGSQYPADFPWSPNISFIPHVPPVEHPAFYCSSRLTLNVTRGPMAAMGYCPSGRLFEAAACGVPVISDEWEGIDQFFEPGVEILLARTTSHIMEALELPPAELSSLAEAARERVLSAHTSMHRAAELEGILEAALQAPREQAPVEA